jgi:hypothetical protein
MDLHQEMKTLAVFGILMLSSIAVAATEICNKYPKFVMSVIITIVMVSMIAVIIHSTKYSYKYKIRKTVHPLIPFHIIKHNTTSLSQNFVYYYNQKDIETVLNIINEPNYNPNMAFYSGFTYYPNLTDFVLRNYDRKMSEVYVGMLLDPRTDITMNTLIKMIYRNNMSIELLKLYIAFRLKSKDEIDENINSHCWVELRKIDSYTTLLSGLEKTYDITTANIKNEYYHDSVPELHKLAGEGNLEQIKNMVKKFNIKKKEIKYKPKSLAVSQSMESLTPTQLWG